MNSYRQNLINKIQQLERQIDETDRIFWSDFEDTDRKHSAKENLIRLCHERRCVQSELVDYDMKKDIV